MKGKSTSIQDQIKLIIIKTVIYAIQEVGISVSPDLYRYFPPTNAFFFFHFPLLTICFSFVLFLILIFCVCVCVCVSCSLVSDSLWPHGLGHQATIPSVHGIFQARILEWVEKELQISFLQKFFTPFLALSNGIAALSAWSNFQISQESLYELGKEME